MAYPDDLLVDGERVVLHTHPHAKCCSGPSSPCSSSSPWACSSPYSCASRRGRRGRGSRWASSGPGSPSGSRPSVQFRHTVLGRVLGCGTLVIESASDEPLEFTDVPRVERVHALLYQEVADDV